MLLIVNSTMWLPRPYIPFVSEKGEGVFTKGSDCNMIGEYNVTLGT